MFKNKATLDAGVRQIADYQYIFKCPICSQSTVVQTQSLVCRNRHSFDIAKHGYVNLMSRAYKTKYDKQLFAARTAISAGGFFEPMIEQVYEAIIDHCKPTGGMLKIVDAGCGEGSHLSEIQRRLSEHSNDKHLGVGIDIAKEGISLAARKVAGSSRISTASDTIWCVADLANCPFANQSFDVIVNLLSPANYTEFQRLLADDGLIIKVVPESQYLQQLRAAFYSQTDKDIYSNEQALELFKRHFQLLDVQRVQYEATLNQEQIQQLIQMTPLSWRVPRERIQEVIDCDQMKITFDYCILIGKKNSQ